MPAPAGCCWRSSPFSHLVRCWCGHPFNRNLGRWHGHDAPSAWLARYQWRSRSVSSLFALRHRPGLGYDGNSVLTGDRLSRAASRYAHTAQLLLESAARPVSPSLCNLQFPPRRRHRTFLGAWPPRSFETILALFLRDRRTAAAQEDSEQATTANARAPNVSSRSSPYSDCSIAEPRPHWVVGAHLCAPA